MPLLRSRAAVRRTRWAFLKVFFLAMGLLAAIYALLVLVRLVVR
jgi:hypothetical protein